MTERGKSRQLKADNPSVYRKVRREVLRCAVCPPNRGENATRKPKHGVRKPRYKDKR